MSLDLTIESYVHAVGEPASEIPAACPQARGRPELTMEECLRRVHKRDEEAARELVERLYPLVIKIVRAYLPRRTSEEDLVQTVFMKIFSRLEQYSGLVPIEHWVSRIAVNTCLKEIKAEKIRPEWRWTDLSEEEQYVAGALASSEEDTARMSGPGMSDLLQRLLSALSAKDRLVIQLLHLEERSVAEIHALTGWSAAVIKVRAFRARKKLRRTLEAMEAH